MNPSQYLKRTALFAILVSALVVGFNWIVDPYSITGVDRIEGFNASKIDINLHTRLMKKYHPEFGQYDTLIVGKSRVEMALNPAHHCFTSAGMAVYNLGIPGATLDTQLSYALNMIYQQDIQHLFLTLDFTDFISTTISRTPATVSFFERKTGDLKYLPSGDGNPDYLKILFTDYLKALFSIDATVSSVQTLTGQGRYAPDRTQAGFNPGHDFEGVVAVEGANALFTQKMGELVPKYGRPWYLRDEQGELPDSFTQLDQFLDIALGRGIEVYLFTSPLHAQYWELMEAHGHLALQQDWMEEMGRRLALRPGQAIEFWDFAADSPYIHEAVPAPGVLSGPLNWFWEPSHYRRELGDLMLQTMLAPACDTEPVFGRRLY